MNTTKFFTPSALGVPIFYIGLGFLWILSSDKLVSNLIDNDNLSSQTIFYINIAKGLGFVFFTGLTLYITDIVKARKVQNKIIATEKNLYALINNTSDLMWSVDKNFQIIYANEAFKQTVSNITGRKWDVEDPDLIRHFSDAAIVKWQDYFSKAINGETFCVEESYELRDKSMYYSETCFKPILDETGTITGAGCYSRDITQRKLNEIRIAEQNQKLKDIAWVQSHEVRGPVTTIMALNNMINRKNFSDEENIEMLEMLDVATKKLDMAIRDIVEMASTGRKAA